MIKNDHLRRILRGITALTELPTTSPCTQTGSLQGNIFVKLNFNNFQSIKTMNIAREQREALDDWLDWVSSKDDVYFVTGTQTLLWMTDPTPVSKLGNFQPWQCDNKPVALPLSSSIQ